MTAVPLPLLGRQDSVGPEAGDHPEVDLAVIDLLVVEFAIQIRAEDIVPNSRLAHERHLVGDEK